MRHRRRGRALRKRYGRSLTTLRRLRDGALKAARALDRKIRSKGG